MIFSRNGGDGDDTIHDDNNTVAYNTAADRKPAVEGTPLAGTPLVVVAVVGNKPVESASEPDFHRLVEAEPASAKWAGPAVEFVQFADIDVAGLRRPALETCWCPFLPLVEQLVVVTYKFRLLSSAARVEAV